MAVLSLPSAAGPQQAPSFPHWLHAFGLRRVARSGIGDDQASFAGMTHLEHPKCTHSTELSDISALTACTASKARLLAILAYLRLIC